jgi:hypothetical protein
VIEAMDMVNLIERVGHGVKLGHLHIIGSSIGSVDSKDLVYSMYMVSHCLGIGSL